MSEPFTLHFEPANDRGFLRAEFKDRNNDACSIQESSIIDEQRCIWLGMNRGTHTHHKREEVCMARMHLTQDMARELGLVLLHFAETGELIDPATTP